ncbi:MAG: DUF4835 family protein [Cyclobacteriaceae bacterium]
MKFLSCISTIFCILITLTDVRAQELNCRVIVNAEFAQTTEKSVFRNMESSLASFLNETKWTDDTYKPEERIKCNLIITIQEIPNIGNYSATVQIVSSRPVYGTDYESVVFNFADRDWEFEYAEAQSIIFDQNTFTTNLASLLAYYAYVIIGYDYDSFSPKGGEPFFQKALEIVNNAQRSGFKGWDQFNDSQNRYWLAENLTSAQLQSLRELTYSYYKEGLDVMIATPDETRKNIAEAISKLEVVNRIRPRTIAMIAFIDAKDEEIINIFSEGDLNTRRAVYNTLIQLDPSKKDDYTAIIKN